MLFHHSKCECKRDEDVHRCAATHCITCVRLGCMLYIGKRTLSVQHLLYTFSSISSMRCVYSMKLQCITHTNSTTCGIAVQPASPRPSGSAWACLTAAHASCTAGCPAPCTTPATTTVEAAHEHETDNCKSWWFKKSANQLWLHRQHHRQQL
jgi:hypothetical protein